MADQRDAIGFAEKVLEILDEGRLRRQEFVLPDAAKLAALAVSNSRH